ncbi:MAG: DUF3429 domain-containing protein [Halioglobus sp.]
MNTRRIMQWLGYAGALPFAGFALGTLLAKDYLQALSQQGFVIYSLAILCFLAGTLWGSASSYSDTASMLRVLVSNGLVLFAALSVLTAQALLAAALLMLGYLALLWFERNSSDNPAWYVSLRTRLTLIVVLIHLCYLLAMIFRNGH